MPSVVGAVNISNVLVSSSVEFGDCLAIKPKSTAFTTVGSGSGNFMNITSSASTANTIDMDINDQNVVGNA
jgi:spore germination protein PF